MTDHIGQANDDLDEEDPRAPLWEGIANAIATLSDATDAPTGVSAAYSSISRDDVDMTSDSWISQLTQVQGWLNLGLSQSLHDAGRDAFLAGLIVKFRLFINTLEEQFWFFHTPGFECINRRKMAESALRDVVVVGQQVVVQSGLQLGA